MTRLFDLSGRLAVVVGGTSGIGRAIALGLADAGADVVVTGRRAANVEAVAAEIESRGRRTLRVPADVAETSELERVRDACVARPSGGSTSWSTRPGRPSACRRWR